MAKKKPGNDGRERGGFKSSRHGSKRASAAGPKGEQKRAAEERESRAASGGAGVQHTSHEKSRFLRGQRIEPRPIDGHESAADLIDSTFLAYNAARLR